MSLKDRLNHMKKEFESKIPPEALALMHRATEDLMHSGIMEHVLKKGDRAPEFTLPDEQGNLISSSELLGKGPLAVSFYRGIW